MSTIDIFLLDEENNINEELNIVKPNTYHELLEQSKQNFKEMPANYEIFTLDENYKEIKIANENEYELIKNLLFIREINKGNLEKSSYQKNFDKLSDSKQEILEQNYNCYVCGEKFEKEEPYCCLRCKKSLIHKKCLEQWANKRKQQNDNLSCPMCRYELPIEKWIESKYYKENRDDITMLMNKLN